MGCVAFSGEGTCAGADRFDHCFERGERCVDVDGFLQPGIRVQGSGFGVEGLGLRFQGSGCSVRISGFRVQRAGFRVQGAGCRACFALCGLERPCAANVTLLDAVGAEEEPLGPLRVQTTKICTGNPSDGHVAKKIY